MNRSHASTQSLLSIGISLICSSLCFGQADWAQNLFAVKKHDFGSVGRGAEAEYHFVLKNNLPEEVVISKLKTSCGCTTPSIANGVIKPGEESAVVATFNTASFTGMKSAVVTVVFSKPKLAEVQLQISGYIRTDVVIKPRSVDFGSFRAGDVKPVTLEISYSGGIDWKVEDVRSPFEQLQVSLSPRRKVQGGYAYDMKVGLKNDIPIGSFRQRMTLVTNEPVLRTISVDVVGRVEPDLILTPSSINLGSVQRGTTVKKRIVLRGPEPFAVKSVQCKDERFQMDVPQGKKPLHFVNVEFEAGEAPGKIFESIQIKTDLEGSDVAKCPVSGEVL